MCAASVHCVADCVIRRVVPQPTEWERIGDEIKAAMIFPRANLVSVHQSQRRNPAFQSQARFGSTASSDGLCTNLPFGWQRRLTLVQYPYRTKVLYAPNGPPYRLLVDHVIRRPNALLVGLKRVET